ncbi:unnamed protein product, partial [Prorocentrum cordatum]
VYAFGDTDAEDIEALRFDARALALVMGVPSPPAAPGAVIPRWIVSDPGSPDFGKELDVHIVGRLLFGDAVGIALLSEEEGWVSVENVQERDEEAWLAEKRRGPGRDPRISPLSRRTPGQPVMLPEALARMSSIDIEDWPFRGPKALPEQLAAVLATGLTLTSYWGFWVSESGVSRSAGVALEMRRLLNVLRHRVTHDLLDASNLASFELLGRRALQIQRAVKRCPRRPSFEGLGLALSSSLGESGGAAASRPDAFVAEEQKAQGIILEQERLFREEQQSDAKKCESLGAAAVDARLARHPSEAGLRPQFCFLCRGATGSTATPGGGNAPLYLGAWLDALLMLTLAITGLWRPWGRSTLRRPRELDGASTLERPASRGRLPPRSRARRRVRSFGGRPVDMDSPKQLRGLAPRHVSGVLDNADPGVARPRAHIPQDQEIVEPRWGPLLNPCDRRSRSRLIDFLRRLAERGPVDGRRRRKACVSAFFVARKNGDIRMVVGARLLNQLHKLPPRAVLASGEALGSINLLDAADASPQDLADFDGCFGSLCAGSVDLMGGFYQFAVTADEIGLDSIFDEMLGRRVAVASDQVLVDAMGAAGLQGDGWCLDGARAPALVGRSVARAPCVDHGNLVSLSGAAIDDPGEDGREGRLRSTAKRAWRPYLALHHVLREPWLVRWQLRRIVGHIARYFSVLRPGLSALGACCARIASGDLVEVGLLPRGVLGVLAAAARLVFLGEVDLCRVPSDIAFATDSSTRGCAVCEARLGPRGVLAAIRWRERQRSVASEVEIASDDELREGHAAGLSDPSDPLPAATPPRHRRAVARRRRVELEIGASLEPLAEALLDPSRWAERRRGAWRCPGRIHALEARAAVAPLWRAGGDVAFHEAEVLSLCDNMSSVPAFEKDRATNFERLAQRRQAAAICLGEIRWRPRRAPGSCSAGPT